MGALIPWKDNKPGEGQSGKSISVILTVQTKHFHGVFCLTTII